MKTKTFFTSVIFAASLIGNSINAQWIDITPTDTSVGFGKISFSDSQNGYVAGISSNKLFKTTNGGTSWTTIIIDSLNQITDVHFISSSVGFAIGGNFFPINTWNVSKTTDGGSTWQPMAPVVGDFYSTIFFKDATTGFLASQQGGMYKTTDTGSNWTKVDSTFNEMMDESYPNPASDTGYFVGWDGTFGYQGVIAKTTDGGNNWSSTIPLGWNSSLSSIHMLDGQTGYIIEGLWGSAGSDYIYKTLDGFSTLDSVLKPTFNIYDIYFISLTEGYLLADSGIYKTIDGTNFVKELSFTAGQYDSRFERAGNDLFVTAGDKVFKTSLFTGIEDENNKDPFKLYPNPTSNHFIIEGEREGTIELLDLTGKLVQVINKDKESIKVSIDELGKGIYFLKFDKRVQKLIIH